MVNDRDLSWSSNTNDLVQWGSVVRELVRNRLGLNAHVGVRQRGLQEQLNQSITDYATLLRGQRREWRRSG